METSPSFESPATSTFAESLRTPETVITEVKAELASRLEQVSEAPETCELQGRTWECAGDTRRELIGQKQEELTVARNLLQEVVDANAQAEHSSPEQRATYHATNWLSTQVGIMEHELNSTLLYFKQADLEARAANDNTFAEPGETQNAA